MENDWLMPTNPIFGNQVSWVKLEVCKCDPGLYLSPQGHCNHINQQLIPLLVSRLTKSQDASESQIISSSA